MSCDYNISKGRKVDLYTTLTRINRKLIALNALNIEDDPEPYRLPLTYCSDGPRYVHHRVVDEA